MKYLVIIKIGEDEEFDAVLVDEKSALDWVKRFKNPAHNPKNIRIYSFNLKDGQVLEVDKDNFDRVLIKVNQKDANN